MTCFIQNLLQNLKSSVLASKSIGEWLANSNSQIVLEKHLYIYFAV